MSESPPRQHIYVCDHASSNAFNHVTQSMAAALRRVGHEAHECYGAFEDDGHSLYIVLGAHLYSSTQLNAMRGRCVIYNLEPVDPSVQWMTMRYFDLMKRHAVWDYCERNVTRLHASGIAHALHVPIGFDESLTQIDESVQKDIDVLFYGTPSPRRNAVMEQLRERGLRVFQTLNQNLVGSELFQMLSRSKVGLNLHFYDKAGVFEDVRVAQMLANKLAVVGEVGNNTFIDGLMKSCVVTAPYEKLVDSCVDLVRNQSLCSIQARTGYERFSKRRFDQVLNAAVAQTRLTLERRDCPSERAPTHKPEKLPRSLQIGAGRKWRYDMVNLDIDRQRGADWVMDLNQPVQIGSEFESWRLGRVLIEAGMFDYILSEHVFEHIQNLTTAMHTCLDLLGEGGILEIEVPYDLSYGAWQDPTHVRAFNQNSWIYYGDWCWYLGWKTHRFDLISQVFNTSPYGDTLVATLGGDIEVLARHPRAIDSLRVKLRKRALTEHEVMAHEQFFKSDSIN